MLYLEILATVYVLVSLSKALYPSFCRWRKRPCPTFNVSYIRDIDVTLENQGFFSAYASLSLRLGTKEVFTRQLKFYGVATLLVENEVRIQLTHVQSSGETVDGFVPTPAFTISVEDECVCVDSYKYLIASCARLAIFRCLKTYGPDFWTHAFGRLSARRRVSGFKTLVEDNRS